MKNLQIKRLFVFKGKDGETGAFVPIAQTLDYKSADFRLHRLFLESGQVLCFNHYGYDVTNEHAEMNARMITSYWYEDKPDEIFDGCFILEAQSCLLTADDSGVYGEKDIIAQGRWIRHNDGIYVVRQAHKTRTLCIPHDDEVIVIRDVNSGFLRDNTKLYYHVDNDYYVLWFNNWRIQHLGEQVSPDLYDRENLKKLYWFKPESNIKEVISYHSLQKRRGRLIAEVYQGKYRIFEGWAVRSTEITEEYYILPSVKPQIITVFYLENGFYSKIEDVSNVTYYTQNAYVITHEDEKVHLLMGLNQGKPFLIASYKGSFAVVGNELCFNGDTYRINNEMLDYKPVKRPWWKFW